MEDESKKIYNSTDFFTSDLDKLLDQFPHTLRSHSLRVATCCFIIAGYAKGFPQFYDMPAGVDLAVIANLGGALHDVGKLLLPVVKTTKTNYRRHPRLGADFLKKHKAELFENEVQAQLVIEMAQYHHEQPDGKGFPDGLTESAIPFMAGLCAVADKIDRLLYARRGFYNDVNNNGVLKSLKKQARVIFIEDAVSCAEQVWPQLMKHYANWNRNVKPAEITETRKEP